MDMKKTITRQQQSYINDLLKKRREREVNKLLSTKKTNQNGKTENTTQQTWIRTTTEVA